MLRRLAVTCLVAGALAAPAGAIPGPPGQMLMPGVYYQRQVQFTPHGPVVVNVVTAPRPVGLWSLQTVLGKDAVPGAETLTSIERRLAPTETTVGVNGDYFNVRDGHPTGIVVRGGALDHTPYPYRSSLGVDAQGTLHVDRVRLLGTWQGSGQRRQIEGVNQAPDRNGVTLYTPAFGLSTPPLSGGVEVVLSPFPPATPGASLTGPATAVANGGSTPIPAGGAVLAARGPAAARLEAEAPVGQTVAVRLLLQPAWAGVTAAIGGGPVLVRNGKPVFRSDEDFDPAQLLVRSSRTAVGQRADGTILLVVVDGSEQGYSSGMTAFELAQTLVRLGAVTAMQLGSGASSALAADGTLLSTPSGAREQPVGDALLVAYAGVYSPPPLVKVLSPNGDGVDDVQRLSYTIVRPSTVTTRLLGPGGTVRSSQTAQQQPGTYPFEWNGLNADGTPAQNGRWQWFLTAVDDQGGTTSVDRTFWVNDTLGFLKKTGPALLVPRAAPRAIASFRLARPAGVTATVETASGVAVRSLDLGHRAAGAWTVSWDGTSDAGDPVYPGSYVVSVAAANAIGKTSLVSAPFTVRAAPAARATSAAQGGHPEGHQASAAPK